MVELAKPRIMGILNLTPDSFYDGGKYRTTGQALEQARIMLEQGAHFLDLGATSSRPGAELLPRDEEGRRLEPVLKAIVREFPGALVSVDTYYAETARMAVNEGACMINDISAGSIDPMMFETIGQLQVPYVLMHMKGHPKTMQQQPVYLDLIKEITAFFAEKIDMLTGFGVRDILIDPGFGFGKTLEQNYQLLYAMDFFAIHERPLVVGVSRKSMVSKVLGVPAGEALNGTTVVHTMALLKGADILRVHDVREAMEAIRLTGMYQAAAT